MTELKRLILDALKTAGFSAAEAKPWIQSVPVEQEKICVSIRKLEAEQGAVYRYLGCDETGIERYGMALKMVAALVLLSPKEQGGASGERFAERVFQRLMAGIAGFPVAEISCGETAYDGVRDCFQTEILVQSRVVACGVETEEGIVLEDFRIQGTLQ